MEEMKAIGRISNPFIYEADLYYCYALDHMAELKRYLNSKARDGWRLHTVNRLEHGQFFCVWEKLDYGEKEA